METLIQSQSYDINGITEMSWDCSHVMDTYSLFRKDRRRGKGDVAAHVKAMYSCLEVQYEVESKTIESIRVKVRGDSSSGDVMVSVCYRLPNQEEDVDKAFFKQLMKASK